MFNKNDIRLNDGTVSISGGIQSEGEMESEKVIQYPENYVGNLEKTKDKHENDTQSEKELLDENQDLNTSSTIPFPSVSDQLNQAEDEDNESESTQSYG